MNLLLFITYYYLKVAKLKKDPFGREEHKRSLNNIKFNNVKIQYYIQYIVIYN